MNLAAFLTLYPPAPPAKPADNADELRQLGPADGVRILPNAPADNEFGSPAPKRKGDPGCQLWVIRDHGIPYLAELAPVEPPLQSGKVKHTNLTGGGTASCGGELWFDSKAAKRIYLNGCSGRYRPRSKQQLDDAVALLTDMGYEVESFGWNRDNDAPEVLRP